jgi:hypothetical protein
MKPLNILSLIFVGVAVLGLAVAGMNLGVLPNFKKSGVLGTSTLGTGGNIPSGYSWVITIEGAEGSEITAERWDGNGTFTDTDFAVVLNQIPSENRISIGAGIFDYSVPIELKTNWQIEGSGLTATQLVYQGTYCAVLANCSAPLMHGRLRDLTISCGGAIGLLVIGDFEVDAWLFDNIFFYGASRAMQINAGFRRNYCSNVYIEEYTEYGILLDDDGAFSQFWNVWNKMFIMTEQTTNATAIWTDSSGDVWNYLQVDACVVNVATDVEWNGVKFYAFAASELPEPMVFDNQNNFNHVRHVTFILDGGVIPYFGVTLGSYSQLEGLWIIGTAPTVPVFEYGSNNNVTLVYDI